MNKEKKVLDQWVRGNLSNRQAAERLKMTDNDFSELICFEKGYSPLVSGPNNTASEAYRRQRRKERRGMSKQEKQKLKRVGNWFDLKPPYTDEEMEAFQKFLGEGYFIIYDENTNVVHGADEVKVGFNGPNLSFVIPKRKKTFEPPIQKNKTKGTT